MRAGRIFGAAAALALLSGTAQADLLDIRIAWVVPVGNWASIIYEKKDLMTHYGKTYTVTPTHFAGTPPMITALAAGELDIADLAYSSFATAVENAGMTDLKFIADEAQDGAEGHDSGAFYVLKDGPIQKVEDLKGKVVADVGAGSAVDIAMKAMLKKRGLETPRDYTVVEAAFPNMEALLEQKKADLIAAVQPFTLKPSFIANTRPLFTDVDALGGATQFVVWTAHADYIAKNRAALVDMFEDAVRATRWLTDPKNHDAVVQLAAQITKQPPEQLQYVFGKTDLYRDPNMLPNIPNLQRAVDAQQEVGFLKQKLDVAPYADLSMVKEAAARIK
ncbi:MAG TPA: ABC transporter substrate-binding protein [Stellaceae bacterium]|jgi:NitT/TauT family transport system substrate-binding protein|nr:ABC transporter substrate-binding protein [Stellaceae bacterium]